MAISLLFLAAFVPIVTAVPVTGAAINIESNNVTIPLAGVAGTEAWVVWGQNPDGEIWNTANFTPTAGAVDVYIWGAPLFGSTVYYAKGCDNTGCGNEVSFTTAAITPVPTTTFGRGYQNISNAHFDIRKIAPNLENVYTDGGARIPRTMLYGILIGLVFIGLWFRTRSIRICSTLGIILGSMLWTASGGLYLGIPLQEQLLGQLLLAAGLAGWALSLFVKK
jgi:hypothetical protein